MLQNKSGTKKKFLAELLIKLPLSNYHKYKKNTFKYLNEYVGLSPNDEGLSKISYIIENLDKNSYVDSLIYKNSLHLKAELLCDLGKFKSAYEIYSLLIEHLVHLKKTRFYSLDYLSEEEIGVYLNTYSLGYLNHLVIDNNVSKVIDSHCKTNLRHNRYEVQFKSDNDQQHPLTAIALLYYNLKIKPPKWFPKHTLVPLNFPSISPEKDLFKKTNHLSKPRLNKIFLEKDPIVQATNSLPEHEKIREKITLGWEQHGVGGYKSEIKELVEHLFLPRALSPELLKKMALKLPRGGILYGPPGTGKTLMARTIANYFFEEKNVTVINGPALLSKYVGQSAENLRNILEVARTNPQVTHVVIIDEIDALVCQRNSTEEGLSTQLKADLTTTLLTYLDGVDVIDNLMILGLTNYLDKLDDALIRPGRLGVHIHIGLPDYENRLAIITMYLSDLQNKNIVNRQLNLSLLAEKTQGLSGAGLKAFIDSTVEKFSLSQIVSFEKGSLKIGSSDKLIPLDEAQFLMGLGNILRSNKHTQSEYELLLSRPFCRINQSLHFNFIIAKEKSYTFPYFNPMLIHISGVPGTGTTSFALNLFKDMPNKMVYMKAGELVNLSAKEQQKYIDNCFSQALLTGDGVLIIDDLEDINACLLNPTIHLRNKLKMPLPQGEKLKIILISKKEETIQHLFNNQIDCETSIKVPLITQKNELITLIKSLEMKINLKSQSSVDMKIALSIQKLKSALLIYENQHKPEIKNIDDCINHLNALYLDNYNANRMFRVEAKGEEKSVRFNVLPFNS